MYLSEPYQNRKEEGVAANAQETEDEVDSVVQQLWVGDHAPRRLGQRAAVAHDAD